ncbi:MAG: hypothetical protein M1827_000553 [Pycnora praestabilis]|nr:MAG: hypothetical protein M1827_000553 [Pycnora praestabilis]
MSSILRDSALGQLIRLVSGNKLFLYPEEQADFQIPENYHLPGAADSKDEKRSPSDAGPQVPTPLTENSVGLEKEIANNPLSRSSTNQNANHTLEQITSKEDLERAFSEAALEKETSRAIVPQRTTDGIILVDWYTTDDPENPQNWSTGKKGFTTLQICLYTFAVYTGSAIYSTSEQGVMERFGVGSTAASLGLALYVLAYGIGPLLFSPLSEIPVIGRNPPYIATFAIFVILCVPTALVDNFGGLLVLRFLQGFFGSPCLATGGASLQDMYTIFVLPYMFVFWTMAATSGPALGPTISGFAVAAENWRWSLWEMLWISGPVFLLLFICLPETSAPNLLLRRARRLRKLTGNENLRSQSEINQSKLTAREVFQDAVIKPFEITLLDPAVTFATLYTALMYGIYYSFFEAFPLVYPVLYGFNLGETGLAFICITIAVLTASGVYAIYIHRVANPHIRNNGIPAPERQLLPALVASFIPPIGLFLFGWTARKSVHWIASVFGIGIFTLGVFPVFQSIFMYLPFTYPQYAASLFAANDFARSSLGAAAILFGRPMYQNLGIGPGSSLLGGLMIGGVAGVWALWYWGPKLRARSKFAVK